MKLYTKKCLAASTKNYSELQQTTEAKAVERRRANKQEEFSLAYATLICCRVYKASIILIMCN